MNTRNVSSNLFFISLNMIFVGCVSVGLPHQETQKSSEATFSAPKPPFREFKSPAIDNAWRNEKNGNIISYLSDCFNPEDPSLESVYRGVINEIEDVQIIQKSKVDFNSREGLHAIVEGQVDGLPTRIELMLFKKNHCTYVLSYAGVAESFGANQREFTQFVKGFQVP